MANRMAMRLAAILAAALMACALCACAGGGQARSGSAGAGSNAQGSAASVAVEVGSAAASEASSSVEAAVPSVPPPLIVQTDPALYTYEDLTADVATLAETYPTWVQVDSLGATVDGRKLHHLIIGNPDAPHKILVTGGIHAREYMTVQLVMKQAAAFLEHAVADDAYGASSYRSILEDAAIHVVPSVNPDGAAISQNGLDGALTEAVRSRLVEIAALDGASPDASYFREWKANANGVDLNRQFDALWSEFQGTPHPSSDRYKGTAPGSEVESRALIDLTQEEGFDRTISYHTHGSVVYWYFAQTGALYDDTLAFADSVSAATGYPLDANYEALDPAGYKDWAIQSEGIPSLTIEVGVAPTPVPPEQFPTIWAQNEHVWETALKM